MNKDQDLEKLSKSTKSTESKEKGDSSSNHKAPQENVSSASSSITSDSVTMQDTLSSTPRKEPHTPPFESPADSPRPPSKDEVSGRPTREGLVDSPRRAQFPFGVPLMNLTFPMKFIITIIILTKIFYLWKKLRSFV